MCVLEHIKCRLYPCIGRRNTLETLYLRPRCSHTLRSTTKTERNIWCLWVCAGSSDCSFKNPALLAVLSRALHTQIARFASGCRMNVPLFIYNSVRIFTKSGSKNIGCPEECTLVHSKVHPTADGSRVRIKTLLCCSFISQ